MGGSAINEGLIGHRLHLLASGYLIGGQDHEMLFRNTATSVENFCWWT